MPSATHDEPVRFNLYFVDHWGRRHRTEHLAQSFLVEVLSHHGLYRPCWVPAAPVVSQIISAGQLALPGAAYKWSKKYAQAIAEAEIASVRELNRACPSMVATADEWRVWCLARGKVEIYTELLPVDRRFGELAALLSEPRSSQEYSRHVLESMEVSEALQKLLTQARERDA